MTFAAAGRWLRRASIGALGLLAMAWAPGAAARSANATRVLDYMASLSSGTFRGTMVGQNCGHGDEIVSSYEEYVARLKALTNKTPAVIGLDYEFLRVFDADALAAANEVLIAHAKRGGIVTINWSPLNPWTGKGPYDKGSVDLKQLADPSSAVHAKWNARLDVIAAALAQLRDAGVVVLWRPMQEMNGTWFWWGAPGDVDGYKQVFRDMHDRFTNELGLDNLLWVYSPLVTGGFGQVRGTTAAYPGDAYVDVVAGTQYNDQLALGDYDGLLSLRKPIGMAEYGRATQDDAAATPDFDDRKYIDVIRKQYRRMAYFVAWHDWDKAFLSIAANDFAAELMNDPDVITLEKLPWATAGGGGGAPAAMGGAGGTAAPGGSGGSNAPSAGAAGMPVASSGGTMTETRGPGCAVGREGAHAWWWVALALALARGRRWRA